MFRTSWRWLPLPVTCLFACLVLVGCGGSGVHSSGKVTFKGEPVPKGKIYFIPDGSKGNKGATGWANIENGVYDTAAAGGKITVGGAMKVSIEGVDPNASGKAVKGDTSGEERIKSLFPVYETTVDLGSSSGTHDFEVPASAANPKNQPETPMINP